MQWGTAIFTDIGNTWSGGVPFGETTTRASGGVGLLAAVPPKSRRILRADIAVPVTGSAPKTFVLRAFAVDATRFFWRDPNDLSPVRAGAPASPIFGWPWKKRLFVEFDLRRENSPKDTGWEQGRSVTHR